MKKEVTGEGRSKGNPKNKSGSTQLQKGGEGSQIGPAIQVPKLATPKGTGLGTLRPYVPDISRPSHNGKRKEKLPRNLYNVQMSRLRRNIRV